MKITTYQQLDELVAKELGYYFKEDKKYYCRDWYNPTKDYIGLCVPKFSTDYLAIQEVIRHIHSLDLDLNIQSNRLHCYVQVQKVDRNEPEILEWWEALCGKYSEWLGPACSIDSPINSFPLAICLAFLKYKGIEVELDLHDLV